MSNIEKLQSELAVLAAHTNDPAAKAVLEHFIECVPEEIAYQESLTAEDCDPEPDYDAVSADEANDARIEIYNTLK